MNKKLLILIVIFSSILPIFGNSLGNVNLNDRFFKALGAVESSNNPKAYNKKEDAIGIFQIRPAYFKDAVEFDKNLSKYKHSDCYSPEISKLIVKSYMARYCKNGNVSDLARAHNSGPNWKNKKDLTNNYWEKFKKYYNEPSLCPKTLTTGVNQNQK